VPGKRPGLRLRNELRDMRSKGHFPWHQHSMSWDTEKGSPDNLKIHAAARRLSERIR
jgi:hypothetical protein